MQLNCARAPNHVEECNVRRRFWMPKAARHIITMSEDGPIWGARALPVTRGDDRAVEERDAPAFLRGDRGSPTTRDAEAKLAVAKARLDAAREQREQRSAYEHQRPSYEPQRSAPRRAEPREIDLQRTSGGFTALRRARAGRGAAPRAKPPPDDTPPGPPTPAAPPRPPDPPAPAATPRPPDPPTPAASPASDPPTPASPKPATKDESKEKLRQLRQYTRDLLKEKEALEQRLSSAEQVALERRLSSARGAAVVRRRPRLGARVDGPTRRVPPRERARRPPRTRRGGRRACSRSRASKSVDAPPGGASASAPRAAALLGRRGASAAAAPAASAEAAVGRAKDRERLLADLETAAARCRVAAMRTALEGGRFALRFSNARGDARRFAAALEACLEHGARGCYGDYLAGAAPAASIARTRAATPRSGQQKGDSTSLQPST
ncbi:hypothetical protein SO694_000011370 [Aureococcus anophagefferens]|uniref:WH2 domain-containing protein n=1 Tax=Aureococcus anophagefferens TaxID=44056 RepID=A0ABR1GCP6_AURAN